MSADIGSREYCHRLHLGRMSAARGVQLLSHLRRVLLDRFPLP